MGDYWPIGQKEEGYREYQKLKFVKGNLGNYNEVDVDDYSVALGKLFRWVKQAIDIRYEDVRIRRNATKQ